MGRLPGDLLVQFNHAIAEGSDLHEPGRDRAIDEGLGTAPAMRVRVIVGGVTHNGVSLLQGRDDPLVGIKDVRPDVVADLSGVTPVLVHGTQGGDACFVRDILVVFAESGRQVHDACAVLGRNEVSGQHLPGVLGAMEFGVREIVEQRRVPASDEVAALECVDTLGVAELCLMSPDEGVGHDVFLTITIEDRVVDVGPDCESQVRRQRPRRRRPGDHVLARLERELHGERRVLAILVDVVHPSLSVRQRGLTSPAVREHAKSLVHVTLVVQRLEGPHHALHVGKIECLVVVVEVDPARLTPDIAPPLIGVLQHARTTGIIEFVDAVRRNFGVTGDAQFLLGFHLCWETVTVPPKATLNTPPPHRLVPRDRILDVAGQQVAVVR